MRQIICICGEKFWGKGVQVYCSKTCRVNNQDTGAPDNECEDDRSDMVAARKLIESKSVKHYEAYPFIKDRPWEK